MRKKQTINFAPLDKLPEKEIIYDRTPIEKVTLFFSVTFGVVALMYFFIYALTPVQVDLAHLISSISLSCLLSIIFAVASVVLSKKSKKKHVNYVKVANKALSDFAQANEFSYSDEVRQVDVDESIQKYFESLPTFETNILTGKLEGFDLKLSDLVYYIMAKEGYGKRKFPTYERVMTIKLPQKMPRIIIDCHVGNAGLNEASASKADAKLDAQLENIVLEGDFSRYFTVKAARQDSIDVLSILTPDIMQQLIAMKAVCDIEFLEDRLYFTWSERKMDTASYEKVFSTAQLILVELERKLRQGKFLTKRKTVAEKAKSSQSLKPKSSAIFIKSLAIIIVIFIAALPIILQLLNYFFGLPQDLVVASVRYYIFALVSLPYVAILFMIVYFGIIVPSKRRKVNKEFNSKHGRRY